MIGSVGQQCETVMRLILKAPVLVLLWERGAVTDRELRDHARRVELETHVLVGMLIQ